MYCIHKHKRYTQTTRYLAKITDISSISSSVKSASGSRLPSLSSLISMVSSQLFPRVAIAFRSTFTWHYTLNDQISFSFWHRVSFSFGIFVHIRLITRTNINNELLIWWYIFRPERDKQTEGTLFSLFDSIVHLRFWVLMGRCRNSDLV